MLKTASARTAAIAVSRPRAAARFRQPAVLRRFLKQGIEAVRRTASDRRCPSQASLASRHSRCLKPPRCEAALARTFVRLGICRAHLGGLSRHRGMASARRKGQRRCPARAHCARHGTPYTRCNVNLVRRQWWPGRQVSGMRCSAVATCSADAGATSAQFELKLSLLHWELIPLLHVILALYARSF